MIVRGIIRVIVGVIIKEIVEEIVEEILEVIIIVIIKEILGVNNFFLKRVVYCLKVGQLISPPWGVS